MSAVRLTILGAANVRCALPVIASLSTYYGERPLEIMLFDADEERLDLFDRFARLSFSFGRATHSLRATTNLEEALEDAQRVIVQIDENCARKLLAKRRNEPDPTDEALRTLDDHLADSLDVLSLLPDHEVSRATTKLDWPPVLSEAGMVAVPHQVLRFLNEEEYVYDLFREHEKSPLKEWLNQPVAL